jgi:hypothetical protein
MKLKYFLSLLLFTTEINFAQGFYYINLGTTIKSSGAVYLVFGNGTLTNNSTIIDAFGTVKFSDAVTYNGTGTAVFNNLTIDQTSGTSLLNSAVSITGTVNLLAGSLNANGNLTITPGAAIIGDYANISGHVILQQHVTAQRGWRMMAHPFTSGQTFSTIAANNAINIQTLGSSNAAGIADVRVFNNNTNQWVDGGTSAAANTAYGLFVRGLASEVSGLTYSNGPTAFTFNVSGTLNGNSVAVNASNSSGHFMVVGNPYAAPVSTIALTGGTAKPYYVYQINQGVNQAAQRTRAGSWSAVLNSSASSTIPVLGVIAYQPSSSSYAITPSDINTAGSLQTGLFRVTTEERYLELQLDKEGQYQDKWFVRQDQGTSIDGRDASDLRKLFNDVTNIYSITSDSMKLAVDSRPQLTVIPMGIKSVSGAYVLRLSKNTFPGLTSVYLNDHFQNKEIDLSLSDGYPFSITAEPASQGDKRFELRIKSSQVMTPDSESSVSPFSLFPNPAKDQIQVKLPAEDGTYTVQLMNGYGSLMHTAIGRAGEMMSISLKQLPAGQYVISLVNGQKTFSRKFIKIQ